MSDEGGDEPVPWVITEDSLRALQEAIERHPSSQQLGRVALHDEEPEAHDPEEPLA